jgi:hypothetical protein
MNTVAGVKFRLLKFVVESNFCDEQNMDFPRNSVSYKSNPRIKNENGIIIVWNDQYQTSIPVKNCVVECCIFSEPPVLIITRAVTTTRIICFISERVERTLKLAGKLNGAKEYREMTQDSPFSKNI